MNIQTYFERISRLHPDCVNVDSGEFEILFCGQGNFETGSDQVSMGQFNGEWNHLVMLMRGLNGPDISRVDGGGAFHIRDHNGELFVPYTDDAIAAYG
jgi:hypothetical protein